MKSNKLICSTVTERQSNMELLRLFAMLMIMIGHALFFPYPDGQSIIEAPLLPFLRFSIGGLSICCVDVFVLISGWFGINYKMKRLISLVFQTLFFSILIYLVLLLWKPSQYQNLDALSTIILFHSDDYWFIKAYIGLYLFAPMLNKYIETATEKQLRTSLIVFYSFQTIYGWLNLYGAHWFEGGFSMVSFMGLYILARYVRLHLNSNRGKFFFLSIYMAIGIGIGVLAFILAALDIRIYGRLLTYTNPLVIIESVCLVVFFSKMHIQSRSINKVAASCLAIYLLHANELVLRPYYFGQIKYWSVTQPTIVALALSVLWILSFAVASIFFDFIRIRMWRFVGNHF